MDGQSDEMNEQSLPDMQEPSVDPDCKVFSDLQYDPHAERLFDVMAGGFIWSDESPPDAKREDLAGNLNRTLLIRHLVAYRASIIRGEPRTEFEKTWSDFSQCFPNWPGFRPERRDRSLRSALVAANDDLIRGLERAEQCVERAERIAAIRKKRQQKALQRRLSQIRRWLACCLATVSFALTAWLWFMTLSDPTLLPYFVSCASISLGWSVGYLRDGSDGAVAGAILGFFCAIPFAMIALVIMVDLI